jgi:hypothetical protein
MHFAGFAKHAGPFLPDHLSYRAPPELFMHQAFSRVVRFFASASLIAIGGLALANEPLFRQSVPIQQAGSGQFNTVAFKVAEPIPWKPALALKGRVRIQCDTPLLYLAMNFTSAAGKRGFIKAIDGPSVKEATFEVVLRDMVTDKGSPVEGPWSAADAIASFTVYAKFQKAAESKLSIEGVELRYDEAALKRKEKPAMTPSRAALFEGAFHILPELRGVHPRLFADRNRYAQAAARFRKEPDAFQRLLPLPGGKPYAEAPIPLDQAENASKAFMLAYLAVSHRVSGDPACLEALGRWSGTLEAFKAIGVNRKSPTTENRDLMAGFILLGFSILYDTSHGQLPAAELARIRRVLVDQAHQSYDDFTSLGSYPYEQNHLIIPVCALGVAAMALADEEPEAAKWGLFARNLLRRSFPALGADGWFFEGISYWNFTMQYPVCYAAALKRCTGENLLAEMPFQRIPEYLAHQFLPNPNFVFDFADWGPRVNNGSSFQRGYDAPWHTQPSRIFSFIPALLAQERPHPLLDDLLNATVPLSSNLSYMDSMFFLMGGLFPPKEPKARPDRPEHPPWHYFDDLEVLHWRGRWSDSNATALAFKCGPPAGHAIARLYPLYPEWRPGIGHAHPDAGSFILWSRGGFLAGDTGYCTKRTEWHNTLTVDGTGQCANEGSAWAAYKGIPYERLNRIRLTNTWLGPLVAAGTAVLEDAYGEALRLAELRRHLVLIDGRFLVVRDEARSSNDHVYQWFLHTDNEPRSEGPARWVLENAGGRLCLQGLGPLREAKAAPTVVETQLYPGPPRPQQRGFHLALTSALGMGTVFLQAGAVQGRGEQASSFTARRLGDGCVELTSGAASCRVWLGPQPELDGAFAFVLREGGKVVALGLSGRRLRCEAGKLSLPQGGSVVLRAAPAGGWKAEPAATGAWKLE